MDAWTVYGKRTCGYTIKSMNMLKAKNIPFTFIDVSDSISRAKIVKQSGMKTVPVIYKGSRLVGGSSDLERYLSSSSSSSSRSSSSRSSSTSYSRK